MAQANYSPEPSMEEILASIRRIISDEHRESASKKSAPSFGVVEENEDESMSVDSVSNDSVSQTQADIPLDSENTNSDLENLPANNTDNAEDQMAFEAQTESVDEIDVPLTNIPNTEAAQTQEDDIASPLVLTDVVEESQLEPFVPDILENLPEPGLMSPQTDAEVASKFKNLEALLGKENQSLENLTTDLLKPFLKQWLDDNLPQIVERLVREEIQRVARS